MTTTIKDAARPPRSWETQTAGVLIAVAASGLLGIILLAVQLGLWNHFRTGGSIDVSALVIWAIDNAIALDLLYFGLLLAYLGAYYWWRHRTRTMLHRVGDVTGAATVHWAVVAWGFLLGLAFVVSRGAPVDGATADELATVFGWLATKTGFRLAAMGLLFYGVWQVRSQVRQAVADSGVAINLTTRPTTRTTPLLAPISALSGATTTQLPPADADFWAKAGQLAADQQSDVAVLEAVDVVARRWALIPASGDVTEVRASIPPGAVITIFPGALKIDGPEGYEPPPADSYYGFLEDAATGALWFQSVTPKRIPAFLARARSAQRWALFPTDTPEAITALVPRAVTTPPA